MKLALIIVGILVGLALLGFIALQVFFFLAKRWEDKDVV
jgi:hypothetical protein